MMKLTRLIKYVSCIAAAVASLAAHADVLDNVRKAKVLRVAIDLAVPPSGMTDDKLQPIGSDVETAKLLAKDLGVALELVQATGPTRIPALQTNKADLVISTLSINAARAKVIDFSIPYATVQSVIAAPKSMVIKGYDELVGKSVAVTRGTSQDADLTAGAKGTRIVRYDDDATTMEAAITGQADIVGTTSAVLAGIVAKAPNRQMEVKFVRNTLGFGIGMRKGESKLHEWVDSWVKENLKNGKLNAIYKKYYGIDLPAEMISGKK